jgi:hypothetical protein
MHNDTSNQLSRKFALSVSEVVRASGVGRTLVFAEIKAGRLLARKCGRRTLVLIDDFQDWLQAMPSSRASAE